MPTAYADPLSFSALAPRPNGRSCRASLSGLDVCVGPATSPIRVDELSLDEKIGQMFVVLGHGVFMPESSWAYQELRRQVRENHVGGVIWSVSNVYETAQLTRDCRARRACRCW